MTDSREITGYSIKDKDGVEKQLGFINLHDAPRLRRQIILWCRPISVLALLNWKQANGTVQLPVLRSMKAERTVETVLHGGGRRIDIPGDVVFVNVVADPFRNAIGFVLEHPSFEVSPDGTELPSFFLHGVQLQIVPSEDVAPDVVAITEENRDEAGRKCS